MLPQVEATPEYAGLKPFLDKIETRVYIVKEKIVNYTNTANRGIKLLIN